METNESQVVNDTWFHRDTPRDCAEVLARYVHRRVRVRLFYGDRTTGVVWDEENDVSGYLSRSIGPHKIPLILASLAEDGGPGILDDCVLAIMVSGKFVYRDPRFQTPVYAIGPLVSGLPAEYTASVYRDGANVANFRTTKQAARWIDFMTGQRMAR